MTDAVNAQRFIRQFEAAVNRFRKLQEDRIDTLESLFMHFSEQSSSQLPKALQALRDLHEEEGRLVRVIRYKSLQSLHRFEGEVLKNNQLDVLHAEDSKGEAHEFEIDDLRTLAAAAADCIGWINTLEGYRTKEKDFLENPNGPNFSILIEEWKTLWHAIETLLKTHIDALQLSTKVEDVGESDTRWNSWRGTLMRAGANAGWPAYGAAVIGTPAVIDAQGTTAGYSFAAILLGIFVLGATCKVFLKEYTRLVSRHQQKVQALVTNVEKAKRLLEQSSTQEFV